MNQLDRDYLRHLQDRIIKQSLASGFNLSDKAGIVDNNNKDITLEDLSKYLYPQFQSLFEECLDINK